MEHLEQMVRNYTCVKVGLTMTFNGRPYRSENGFPDWIAYNIPQMPLYEPIHLEGEDIELVLTHYDVAVQSLVRLSMGSLLLMEALICQHSRRLLRGPLWIFTRRTIPRMTADRD